MFTTMIPLEPEQAIEAFLKADFERKVDLAIGGEDRRRRHKGDLVVRAITDRLAVDVFRKGATEFAEAAFAGLSGEVKAALKGKLDHSSVQGVLYASPGVAKAVPALTEIRIAILEKGRDVMDYLKRDAQDAFRDEVEERCRPIDDLIALATGCALWVEAVSARFAPATINWSPTIDTSKGEPGYVKQFTN